MVNFYFSDDETGGEFNKKVLQSIFTAIEHNRETARTQLGNESVERLLHLLDHLENGLDYKIDFKDDVIQRELDTCKEILGREN